MTNESDARFAALAREALGPNATPLQLAQEVANALEALASIIEEDHGIERAQAILRLCKGANDALIGMLRTAH